MVKFRTGKDNLAYLDDYFLVALIKALCDGQVEALLNICEQICFPVSLENTVWGCHMLI